MFCLTLGFDRSIISTHLHEIIPISNSIAFTEGI